MAGRIPVIMDVDTGVDDALALMLAAASDRLEIKALTCVFGNRSVEETSLNTLKIAQLLGLDVPVARGLAVPFLEPPVDYTAPQPIDVHGTDGLGYMGHLLPELSRSLSPLSAAELTAKVLRESEDSVTIIATGPLTNIAAFLLAYPSLHGKVDRILLMGGAACGGNIKPSAEANIAHDPEAAEVVFTSGLPVYMFGLDATMKLWITDAEREELSACGRTGDFMSRAVAHYSGIYQSIAGLPGAVLHDSLPVAWLIDPDICTLRKYHVDVELSGPRTRGCTVVDTADILKKEPNAFVALDADRERFIQMHIEAARRFS